MSTETEQGFVADTFNLDLDRTTAVVTAMLGFDVLWWVLVIRGHVPMPGMMWLMKQAKVPMAAPGAMELAVFHVGTLQAFAGYIVMWGVMMWAMMYPAMTRFTREYARALDGSAVAVAAAVTAFLLGYNITWALSGVIPLGFHAVLPGGIYGFTAANPTIVVGGVLVLTGLYQLTEFKQSRLRTCCARVSPREADPSEALVEGLRHGVSCIFVSFGYFFLVMPFFGEMNLFWMVALTFPITIERVVATWGKELSVATGAVTLIAGLLVLVVQPDLGIGFAM